MLTCYACLAPYLAGRFTGGSMNAQLWIGFALASLLMGLVPGPGVMSIVGYAIGSGRRTALASVAGMAAGNVMAMSLSLAGVGALLAASSLAFTVLKWLGALYLIGLGMAAIVRSGTRSDDAPSRKAASPRTAFASTIAIGVFHPKTIVFFIAFAPQFISADADYTPQAMILVLTFAAIVGCTDTIYALGAAKASQLARRRGTERWAKRGSGGILIAVGLATGAQQR